MEVSIEEIILFLKKQTKKENITGKTDIFKDLRLNDEKCQDVLDTYEKEFGVKMTNYKWFFHWNGREGKYHRKKFNRINSNPFISKYFEKTERIAITPDLLMEFANNHKWEINYPEKTLPKYNYNIIIGQIILFILVISSFYRFIIR